MTSLTLNGFSLVTKLDDKLVLKKFNVGVRMYIVRKNSKSNSESYSKDGIFTLIVLNSTIKDPVTCLSIPKGHKLVYD